MQMRSEAGAGVFVVGLASDEEAGESRPQRHVRATCVVMPYPFVQETSQVVLGQRNHEVQALPP